MAHYALLDTKNIVINVITGKDENSDGIDWEEYYSKSTGFSCKRTSYNTFAGEHTHGGEPFRKNFAGIGYFYDESKDAFIPPKPFDSWILNQDTCRWEAPAPQPDPIYDEEKDEYYEYYWSEADLNWLLFDGGPNA